MAATLGNIMESNLTGLTTDQIDRLNFPWVAHNLIAVTLGNIIGGALVGLTNWTVYLRRQ